MTEIYNTEPIYRNELVCRECGGKCCKIYAPPDRGGTYPDGFVWFEEYCEDFHMNKEQYDVEPLFDPIVVHARGNEQMIIDLKRRGIDPDACQYLGQHGCLIRWDLRPHHCRIFACERLKKPENLVDTTLETMEV
jgi:hypothetical protein